MAEDPGRVVLELEVVFGRGRKLVTGSTEKSVLLNKFVSKGLPDDAKLNSKRCFTKKGEPAGTYMSNENLCFASKSASVKSRSVFALVLDTVNRIPVNML